MLRAKAQRRETASDRHQWWVLSVLLTGVLALNITFTVFIVSLPKVAGEFHTSIWLRTWTMTGPLLGACTLDGIQGAATGTASMALIVTAVRPEDRVKAMGRWTLVGAGGPVIGVSEGSR